MANNLKMSIQVKLVSFHGEKSALEPVGSNENFWLLIGCTGEIVNDVFKEHPAFPEKGH